MQQALTKFSFQFFRVVIFSAGFFFGAFSFAPELSAAERKRPKKTQCAAKVEETQKSSLKNLSWSKYSESAPSPLIKNPTLLEAAIKWGREKKWMDESMFFSDLGISIGVQIFRIVEVAGLQLLVLRSAASFEGSKDIEWQDLYWVFAFNQRADESYQFKTLSEALSLPTTLRVAFGAIYPDMHDTSGKSDSSLPSDLYYAKVGGDAVEAIIASILSQTLTQGLTGVLDSLREKHPFDPTPKRKWRLKEANFSLRRGKTAEILDVRAGQLDDDFDGYYAGCGGKIGPWDSSYLRRIYWNGEWMDFVRWNKKGKYLEIANLELDLAKPSP